MDDNTFEENTGIEENLDNNGEQQKPELTKKEKAEELPPLFTDYRSISFRSSSLTTRSSFLFIMS